MTVALNRFLVAGATAVALMISTSVASASIGVPKGRPYYGAPSSSGSQTFRSYGPAYTTDANESRQSFSYEPGENAEQPASGGCGCGSKSSAPSKAESHDVAKAPDTARQSFSQEPSNQSDLRGPSRRSGERSMSAKPAWEYQKTDPRRDQR
jgi:hypothetical protein